jgi:multiple sugar transport system substrate-binding protein
VLSSDAFRKKTPYNEAFYQTMFKVKDFWAVPEYADLLSQVNQRLYPYIVSGEGGSAKEVLDGLAADWKQTLQANGHGTGK